MSARIAPWCLIFFLQATLASAQQYDLRTYSLEHGLPSAAVNTLCEDSAGYLWIGTNEGLSRSDGVRFWNIGRSEGLPDDDITAVHCDGDGSIWSGCRSGAVIRIIEDVPQVIFNGDTS